jgi:hypothetical protein
MRKLCGAALLLVLAHGANAAPPSSFDIDPAGRILATVYRPAKGERTSIAVSTDRRAVYVVTVFTSKPTEPFGGPATETRLRIFDLSRPQVPRLLSQLVLGHVGAGAFAERGGHLFIPHGDGLMIVDVADMAKPVIASDVRANVFRLDVAPDGAFVRLTSLKDEELRFRIDKQGHPVATQETRSDLEPVEAWLRPEVDGVGPSLDRMAARVIAHDGSGLRVWSIAPGQPPRVLRSIALWSQIDDAKLLAEDLSAAVMLTPAAVQTVSIAPRSFDLNRLQRLYARLRSEYPKQRIKHNVNEPTSQAYHRWLTTALEDAGVRELLGGADAPAAAATGIAIVNDYGFWLSRTGDPRDAVPVLQRVAALAPSRAVAWLNLGDAARASVAVAETWDEKTRYATVALAAYAAYRDRSGQGAPHAGEFAALHGDTTASENVCAYVAAFYNHGRQSEMWGYPDPVDIAGDGQMRHVYIFDQGTAHVPRIAAVTRPTPTDALWGDEGEVSFEPDQGDAGDFGFLPEAHVLPFKTGYFAVWELDGGPAVVVKPNAGTVCRFDRHFTPILAVDHASAICREAAAGRAFDRVPSPALPHDSTRVAADDLDLWPADGQWVPIDRASDVALESGGAPQRIGYFQIASGRGRGCDVDGIAFLRGQYLEKSPRNKALIESQRGMLDCAGSTAFLIRANGQTLVEIDRGRAYQRIVPTRVLLRLHGETFETVCRVDERVTYTARPAATDAR